MIGLLITQLVNLIIIFCQTSSSQNKVSPSTPLTRPAKLIAKRLLLSLPNLGKNDASKSIIIQDVDSLANAVQQLLTTVSDNQTPVQVLSRLYLFPEKIRNFMANSEKDAVLAMVKTLLKDLRVLSDPNRFGEKYGETILDHLTEDY